jgi:hypothetical protein
MVSVPPCLPPPPPEAPPELPPLPHDASPSTTIERTHARTAGHDLIEYIINFLVFGIFVHHAPNSQVCSVYLRERLGHGLVQRAQTCETKRRFRYPMLGGSERAFRPWSAFERCAWTLWMAS